MKQKLSERLLLLAFIALNLTNLVEARGHSSGGSSGSEEDNVTEVEEPRYVAEYYPGIIENVEIYNSTTGLFDASTSDLCPVPFCTIYKQREDESIEWRKILVEDSNGVITENPLTEEEAAL